MPPFCLLLFSLLIPLLRAGSPCDCPPSLECDPTVGLENGLEIVGSSGKELPSDALATCPNLDEIRVSSDGSRRLLVSENFLQAPRNLSTFVAVGEVELHADVFHGVLKLRRIELDSVEIELNDQSFADQRELEFLGLRNVYRWRELPVWIFHTLTRLKHLDLSYNELEHIQSELIFKQLVNLEYLDLSNNKIVKIPDRTFPIHSKIRTLYLQNNQLTIDTNVVVKNFLENLVNLVEADFSGNQITEFPWQFIHRHPYLAFVNVSNNPIQSLDLGALPVIRKIQAVNLYSDITYLIDRGNQSADLAFVRRYFDRPDLSSNVNLESVELKLLREPEIRIDYGFTEIPEVRPPVEPNRALETLDAYPIHLDVGFSWTLCDHLADASEAYRKWLLVDSCKCPSECDCQNSEDEVNVGCGDSGFSLSFSNLTSDLPIFEFRCQDQEFRSELIPKLNVTAVRHRFRVEGCDLTELHFAEIEKRIFGGDNGRIQTMELANLKLQNLTRETFTQLPALKDLLFLNADIESIEEDVFADLKDLEYLFILPSPTASHVPDNLVVQNSNLKLILLVSKPSTEEFLIKFPHLSPRGTEIFNIEHLFYAKLRP